MEESTEKKYRLVLVEWIDSFGCSSSWGEIKDLHTKPLKCTSVGYLAYDGAECKVIIPHITQPEIPGSTQQGCGDMTIPAVAIVRMVDLKEGQ